MSVTNGQSANQTTFNNAFVSKTSDSSVNSNIELADSDASQGSTITQVQRELNSLNSFLGKTINTAKDVLPTWTNNDVGSSTDSVKVRADELTGEVGTINTTLAGKEDVANKGIANGYCPLDATGVVDEEYLPASITGQLSYKGTWNASTNTPTLADGTGSQGDFYIVTVAGTQDLGSGSITFTAGDWAIHDGSVWEKIEGSQQLFKTEFREITGGEATTKQITLAELPLVAGEVVLSIKGGTTQYYNDDYVVSGNILSWNGLALDGVLASGDKLIIQYSYI